MVQIESSSVLRLILQYLKSAGLNDTVQALSHEANIHVPDIKDKSFIMKCIKEKRWLDLLTELSGTDLPANIRSDLYQLVFLSSIRATDYAAASTIFRDSSVFLDLKRSDPEGYHDFEAVLNSRTIDQSSQHTIDVLENSLLDYFDSLDDSNHSANPMMAIISDAIKWRTQGTTVPANRKFDCLTGFVKDDSHSESFSIPNIVFARITLPGITSMILQPSTDLLVVCTEDGMISLLDCLTGKAHSDYINADTMAVPSHVTCCRFSSDGTIFVAGCADGAVAVWRIANGNTKAIRYLNNFCSQMIKSVDIVPDGNVIACGNKTLYVLGMRSGAVLRQISGVNMAFGIENGAVVGIGKDVVIFDSQFEGTQIQLDHLPMMLHVNENGKIIIDEGVFSASEKTYKKITSAEITCVTSSPKHILLAGKSEIEIYGSIDFSKVGTIVMENVKRMVYNHRIGMLIVSNSEELVYLHS